MLWLNSKRLMAGLVLLLGMPTFAHSVLFLSTSNSVHLSSKSEQKPCRIVLVHLNGNNPSSQTCIDSSTEKTNPNLSNGDCGNTTNLFVDAYQQGAEICFSGTGFANLTDYSWCDFFFCYSWNDTATSFATHTQPATFYIDINGGGLDASYGSNRLGNFTSNPMPNDAVSSVCAGSCPA